MRSDYAKEPRFIGSQASLKPKQAEAAPKHRYLLTGLAALWISFVLFLMLVEFFNQF